MGTAPSTESTAAQWTRHPEHPVVAAVGLAVLLLGMIVVRNSTVSDFEENVFHAINDLPGWLYYPFVPFQLVGALLVGPVLVLIGAAIARRFRLVLAVIIVTVSKLVLERVVKAVVTRERPGTSLGLDINLRGDVSTEGESFVSGHAMIATALAGVVVPYLSGRWKVVPWVIAGLVAFGRVYVGAHNPLDVICGAGLGVAIAYCTNLALGVPADPQQER